jgi:hypothetical protein
MFDIKTHGKTVAKIVALAALGIPTIYFSLPFNVSAEFTAPAPTLQPMQTEITTRPDIQAEVKTQPVLLKLDSSASEIVALSKRLAVERLRSEIAVEKAKGNDVNTNKANTSNSGVMTVLNDSEFGSPHNYAPSYSSEMQVPLIDKIILNGLITSGAKTTAYLSIDNVSVRVMQGDTIKGIKVVHVNANEITLKSGKVTRTLKG